MKPFWKTKNFQIRWNEPLGELECPYAYRFVIIIFGFSIRIHKWLRSDDKRYMHNHPWWFYTFVLKGSYIDVSDDIAAYEQGDIDREVGWENHIIEKPWRRRDHLKQFSFRYRSANHTHYVEIPKGGCWTILITGKPLNKWGFWINNRYLRPLRFFSRYGHPPCHEQ